SQKKIILLGSTGSIGTQTLNCVRRFADEFKITALAAGSNIQKFIAQIEEFKPSAVYIANPEASGVLKQKFGSSVQIFEGNRGLEELVGSTDCDIVVNALVGAVGLRSTILALKRNKRVALANKESLVVGGDLIQNLLDSGNGELLPVDSEHSAIFQCLNGEQKSAIESIILTASGGPFRNLSADRFSSITLEQALNHPTWSMGKKITIDSATLMNKGFEVIEAHHLFKLPYSQLRVWVHPQSIIHSLVEFCDGAVIAQLGLPDMELPIQYALSYPERFPMNGKRLSLPDITDLQFMNPDFDKFPCLKLCFEAGEIGGTAPAVINAANEVAVQAFLERKISFTKISEIVEYALRNHSSVPASSIEVIEKADRETRETIRSKFLN
ncbi:MAG: 1-deoxy-D-xylulose-5-phosphate reductoisomerase, partial [Fibrobacter sp.]|nr:1-deoxy-D-xylulose-5-phosphate reductoisomerase [Fibrobacter sp.]